MEKESLWIETFTGKRFYPFAPRVEDVDIIDIAHALSNICRFGGHSRPFYSVAEHCVILSTCEEAKGSGLQMELLLHDASEAYIGDVPAPIRKGIKEFEDVDNSISGVIARKFCLMVDMPLVCELDQRILTTEAIMLKVRWQDWELSGEYLDVKLHGWLPEEAEKQFLERYYYIERCRKDGKNV
jgi:hypothetical protein